MDFDEAGNLIVAHWGSDHLEVFGPDGGSPHSRIKLPSAKPSNVHFQKGTIQFMSQSMNFMDCGNSSGTDQENLNIVMFEKEVNTE